MKFKTTLNNTPVLVADVLKDWTLYQRASTYVDFIGVNPANDSLFIQFQNGICFLYPDLPIDLIKSAVEAESIGKWFHSQLKGKYEGEAIESHCIEPDVEEEDEGDGPNGMSEGYYEGKWDEVDPFDDETLIP